MAIRQAAGNGAMDSVETIEERHEESIEVASP